jgi:2',3'-cyclic-nucleotide 2'-phosphodiesterase (5'-nucleotidase family)
MRLCWAGRAARTFSVLEASMERSDRQTLLMVSAGDLHSGGPPLARSA